MSNINKAADVIDGYLQQHILTRDTGSPLDLARDLADDGLLAPDLPEPDKDSPFPGTSWEVYKEHGGVYTVTSRNGLVYAPGDAHSPTEARAMADALYAAANHAEKEEGHDDLPRMEWPGSEEEGEKLTVDDMWDDSGCPLEDMSRLVEKLEEAEDTAAEPAPLRPEDVPVGEAWQVKVDGQDCIGYRNDPGERLPWTVLYPDRKLHDYLFDWSVTLVARLVPDTGSRP